MNDPSTPLCSRCSAAGGMLRDVVETEGAGMGQGSVLLMLAVTAVVVLVCLRVVVVTDPAARVARFRYERIVRRHAASLIADLERDRRP
jgi:hypothetical protein